MVCHSCSAEVPWNQPICPACFTLLGSVSTAPRREPKQKISLITYMCSTGRAELYHDRVKKYLQLDRVAWNFFASTEEAFLDITKSSSGIWNLLLVDATTVQKKAEQLLRFLNDNPNLVVGIEYESRDAVPPTSPLPGAVAFITPANTDLWLALMHAFLLVAERTPTDRGES